MHLNPSIEKKCRIRVCNTVALYRIPGPGEEQERGQGCPVDRQTGQTDRHAGGGETAQHQSHSKPGWCNARLLYL